MIADTWYHDITKFKHEALHKKHTTLDHLANIAKQR